MGLQVLLLMAGRDDAFKEAGYIYPKNLVEIDGLPLLQRVIDSLGTLLKVSDSFVCVVRKDENSKHHTGAVIRLIQPNAKIVAINETKGAACSALMAMECIQPHDPLVIVNGDQILDVDFEGIVSSFRVRGLEGGIVVFEAIHPRWSFVRCDENDEVVETAEKRPISNLATTGFYYFARAGDFFDAAMEMIKKDAHVDGFFYICPVYNEMILKQRRIGVAKVPRTSYFSLASPTGLLTYEKRLQSVVAVI